MTTLSPRAVLGVGPTATPDAIHAAYRKLVERYHPDRNPGDAEAEEKFKDAGEAYRALTKPAVTADTPTAPAPTLAGWEIAEGLHKGAITDLYRVQEAASGRTGVLKLARSGRDNSLMAREAEALKRLAASPITKYFPAALASFEASSRAANVLSLAEDCLPLSTLREHFSAESPIDFRHVVWMGNRIFEALGIVHRQGIVHGAILPQHLLFRPADHGLVLVDWTCATLDGKGRVPYIVPAFRSHYPPEVAAKRTPTPATDLYMAAAALSYLVGTVKVPRAFQPLVEWCLAESPSARPVDPWDVMDKWKAAAKATYGEPRFIPLVLPSN